MPRTPESQARINRIVFINTEGQLETIAPDGSDPHLLGRGPEVYQFPAWSADGQHIAAVGGTEDTAAIYLFEDDESVPVRQLFFSRREVPVYLYWAPDNEHVSFIALRPSGDAFGLHLVSIDGEHTDRVLTMGRPCFWNWNAQGDEILLHTGFPGEENARLLFADPFDPNGIQDDDNIARPGLFQSPSFSSTGRNWAFAHLNEQDESEIIIDGHGMDEQTVEISHFGVAAMNWNPTREILAFISAPGPSRNAYGPLRLVDPTHEWSEQVETITDDLVIAFFWSPDGESLAYFTLADAYDRVKPLIDVDPHQFDLDGGTVREPEPDSTRPLHLNLFVLNLDDDDEPRLLLTFQPIDIFTNRFLPFFDQFAFSHRIWSPDSDAIVLSVIEKDEPRIIVVPIRGVEQARPRVLANGLMAFWSWQ